MTAGEQAGGAFFYNLPLAGTRLPALIYALLGRLQGLFSRPLFFPVNAFFRLAYVHLLTPALRLLLGIGPGKKRAALEVRNSAGDGRNFNVFSSDIDYSLIISDDCPPEEVQAAAAGFRLISRFLPMVQELEIYSVSDRERLRAINASHGRLLTALRLIRKVAGQERARRSARTGYHRAKALRSAGNAAAALNKYGDSAVPGIYPCLARGLERLLVSAFPKPPAAVAARFQGAYMYSSFLGCHLCAVTYHAENELWLTQGALFTLACLLPDGRDLFPGQAEDIRLWRRTPEIKAAARAVFTAELLTSLSVHYVRPGEDAGTLPWLNRLNFMIEELDAENI